MISSFCSWGNCVQVDLAPDGGVYVRRRVTGDGAMAGQLPFTRAEFRAFVLGVKAGEFDDLIGDEPVRPSRADLFPDPPKPVERVHGAGLDRTHGMISE